MSYAQTPQTWAALTGPVQVSRAAPVLDFVIDTLPDQEFRRYVRQMLEHRELERAARQPVVNVTVPGVPGMFRADLGNRTRAWVTA
jgi:hypothetical protein